MLKGKFGGLGSGKDVGKRVGKDRESTSIMSGQARGDLDLRVRLHHLLAWPMQKSQCQQGERMATELECCWRTSAYRPDASSEELGSIDTKHMTGIPLNPESAVSNTQRCRDILLRQACVAG